TFSPELADLTIYVIDVAAGDKIPRKGGPGITRADLLVINKIDLARLVGASLEVMERDANRMRGERPFVFTNLNTGYGLYRILELPNYEALSEIESSSRLRAVNGALFLSAPLVYRSDADDPQATPVGFILTQEHFITVRFETPTAFTTAAQTPSPNPHDAFAGL